MIPLSLPDSCNLPSHIADCAQAFSCFEKFKVQGSKFKASRKTFSCFAGGPKVHEELPCKDT